MREEVRDVVRRRSTFLVASLAVVAGLIASSAAHAQRVIRIESEYLREQSAAAGDDSATAYSASERGQLRDMALEWRKRVTEGSSTIADELLPDMRRLLDLPGHHEKSVLIGGFTVMGRDWASLKDWEYAESAYEAALEIEPGASPAHLGLGALAWERKGGLQGALGLAGGVVRSTVTGLTEPMSALRVGANLLLILVVAAAVTVGALAIVLMAKYNRLLRHGTAEFLADRVPEGLEGVLGWILVFLPIMLLLSPPWWIVYWLVVFRPYGTPPERRLCLVGLVVLLLVPPAFHVATRLGELQENSVLRAASALDEDDVSPSLVAQLRDVSNRVREPEALFVLGRALEAVGRPDDAIAAFTEAADLDPEFGRALVNRGNIHFRRGDRGAAIADYKRATNAEPTLAIAWRNGSIAYAQDLKADESTTWLRRAQEIDADAVTEWGEQASQAEMVDSNLSFTEIAALAHAEEEALLPGILAALLSPLSIAALLGFAFTLTIASSVLRRFAAASCEKCGRAFCARCHATAKTSAYCTQCTHLYVKKDGVSPVVRSAKLREVHRWVALNSLATRLFNILLPGAGSLYADRVAAGVLLVFLWASALTALLIPVFLVQSPTRMGHEDLAVFFGVELALLVVVYLVALVQSLRQVD